MVKHEAFFTTLGTLEENSAEWKSIFSGLSVLRALDRITSDDRTAGISSDLETSRMAVDQIPPGDPARAILSRILDAVEATHEAGAEIGADLISYGRALDLAGRWPLAADVFKTVVETFSESRNPRTVIEASTLLGAAARSSGDWDLSGRSYARAEYLANRIGDQALALTARVGMASSDFIRGNLSDAEAELEQIINTAIVERLEPVQAIALHARCSVAHQKGEFQQAIHFAYRSLELTTNPSARERLLADIAAAYAELGMWETARDAYSIVAITSPHQWVRWQTTLNLVDLAIQEGDEESYDNYLKQVEGAELDPKLRSYALYFKARGSRRFGRSDADALFEEAQSFAESNRLHQLAYEIEKAKSAPQLTPAQVKPSEDLLEIAEMIGHLRDQAGSGSG